MGQMVKILIGNIYTKIVGYIPDNVQTELDDVLSYRVKDAHYLTSVKQKRWDGIYHLYKRNSGQAFFSGLLSLAEEVLRKNNIQFVRVDERIKPKQNLPELTFIKKDFFEERDYQELTIERAIQSSRGVLKIATGGGKCLGKGTKVLMFDGTEKNVEDIRDNDLLMGPDSTSRRVLSTTNGVGQLYKIKQKNGDDYVCNDAHILCLQKTSIPSKKIKGGEEIQITASDFHNSNKTFKHYHKGYKVGVEFANFKQVPIDPYWLGLWLGDGNSDMPAITSGDKEIVDYIKKFARENDLLITERPGHGCKTYHLVKYYRSESHKTCLYEKCNSKAIISGMCNKHYKRKYKNGFRAGDKSNPLTNSLIELKLLNNKHIPLAYKNNSRDIRLKILAGLIDSDGCFTKTGAIEFCNTNETLAKDVCWLARSLGFRSSINKKMTSIKSIGYKGIAYRVRVSGEITNIPLLLKRKQAGNKTKYAALRYGISIQPIGIGEYYGFEIDGDRKFLLGDFTVTHNTLIVSQIISRLKVYPFMFYVLTEDLMHQAHDVLSETLNEPIGMVGGGEFDIKKITVCTIQTAVIALNLENKAFNINDYKFDEEDVWDAKQIENVENLKKLKELIKNARGLYLDECIDGESEVLTEKGKIKIKDIKEKKCRFVQTHDGNNIVFKRILNWWDKGKKKTLKIKSGDKEVICTNNHLFYTKRGWVKAENLLIEDQLFIANADVEQKLKTITNIEKENLFLDTKLKEKQTKSGNRNIKHMSKKCLSANADVGKEYCQDIKQLIFLSNQEVQGAETQNIFQDTTRTQFGQNIISNQPLMKNKQSLELVSEIPHCYYLTEDQKTLDCVQHMDMCKKIGLNINQSFYQDMDLKTKSQKMQDLEICLLECNHDAYQPLLYLQKNYITGKTKELLKMFLTSLEILDLHGGFAMMGAETEEFSRFTQKDIQKKKTRLLKIGFAKMDSNVQLECARKNISIYSLKQKRQKKSQKEFQNMYPNACSTNWLKIDEIKDHKETNVYDIEVEDTHCFFANGILVHNCHHTSAATVKEVLTASPFAYWRYGGSATPYREDGAEIVIQAMFGKKIVDISASYLIKRGYLVKPYIIFDPIEDKCKMHAYQSIYKTCVSQNVDFNTRIANIANYLLSKKLNVLVLVQHYPQGDLLKTLIPNTEFLTGKMKGKKRKNAIGDLKIGEKTCLLATTLADEGVDIPSLDVVLMAGGGASSTRVYQRIGRALRKNKTDKNKALIIYFHHDAKHLEKHAKKAKKIMKAEPLFEIIESAGGDFIFNEINQIYGFAENQQTIMNI
jgi:superfamily II DNA or RNA helicase/intein/homing endonuclease